MCLLMVTTHICVTSNFSAWAVGLVELYVLGNLAPTEAPWELDKKQWKADEFVWLQTKIFQCL